MARQRKPSTKKAEAASGEPAGPSSPSPSDPRPDDVNIGGGGGGGGGGGEDGGPLTYEEIGGRVKSADGTWVAWELVRPVPRAGQPKSPLLVTVNGLSNDGFQWRGLMPTLRKDHAVLSWDYRGHGCSEDPRDVDAVTIASLAADMEAVMLDVSGRSLASTLHVTVVAYSMGCQVALEWCRSNIQRVAVRSGREGWRVGGVGFCARPIACCT